MNTTNLFRNLLHKSLTFDIYDSKFVVQRNTGRLSVVSNTCKQSSNICSIEFYFIST